MFQRKVVRGLLSFLQSDFPHYFSEEQFRLVEHRMDHIVAMYFGQKEVLECENISNTNCGTAASNAK